MISAQTVVSRPVAVCRRRCPLLCGSMVVARHSTTSSGAQAVSAEHIEHEVGDVGVDLADDPRRQRRLPCARR